MERNTALLERTMQHIQDHPEQHDQSQYYEYVDEVGCSTPSCFAGWAIQFSGLTHKDAYAGRIEEIRPGVMLGSPGVIAAGLLGLTMDEAEQLFTGTNTREMLALMVKDLVNGDELQDHYE